MMLGMKLFNMLKLLQLPKSALAITIVLLIVLAMLLLGYLGYLHPVAAFLDSELMSINIGDIRLSVYLLLKAFATTLVLFWAAQLFLAAVARRVGQVHAVSASNKALIIKAAQFCVYFLLIMTTLKVIGIDLTAFAVFGGAIGIGIGFGLQKITSNYISGVILLMEKTIETGDLVELDDGTFGYIRQNNARYTLVETYNGKEIMVPNEDFITNKVVNWTYTTNKARIDIHLGVSYKSDIRKAHALVLEAAAEHPRCSKEHAPECFLREFADSSVNFLLIFWVDDVTEGRYGPQSEVMFAIWDKFKANNIAIPFPQRDVHLIQQESSAGAD
ncbi:MAG: mechanosensitive ion channel protein MscS [Zetaproteobacteria bacterium CG12_big_fil_rev_8_21_14_0_65_54_13]|nr:MAG: mechanosensitive ion channel protein MscS [Zetaproteobacteria bacterium CG12_big_fil_rev_8_21_14_0_65_54_13]PIX55378.1 MAG: mechanosensitive ion channel protein MscS [Zetaproteobacteria bacterium CG_4_10_14_3_um_filter_54_28]PJA27115.1 MAG: mechanosensitive ion channel protein MscS [Zetaproteobacteria bacterium CG_4_9_14_3_um_filter_54_145]